MTLEPETPSCTPFIKTTPCLSSEFDYYATVAMETITSYWPERMMLLEPRDLPSSRNSFPSRNLLILCGVRM